MKTRPTTFPPASKGQPSTRSLLTLDRINLLTADVRDRVGPYLSVSLKGGEHRYATGFLYLAAIAGCALAFFAVLMPGTRSAETASPGQSNQPGTDAQQATA